jgi:hypothetical protein
MVDVPAAKQVGATEAIVGKAGVVNKSALENEAVVVVVQLVLLALTV